MIKSFLNKYTNISELRLILLSALFLVLFGNFSFFKNVLDVYTLNSDTLLPLISLAIFLYIALVFILSLFSSKYTIKALLMSIFLISSFTAYFMDSYNVVIDDSMIRNSIQTNIDESLDLLSFKLLAYVVFLGILPSLYIYKANIIFKGLKKTLLHKILLILFTLGSLAVLLFSFSQFYTSFFREHKPLRYYVNPLYWIYSGAKYISSSVTTENGVLKLMGLDAHFIPQAHQRGGVKTELIILVVGEAARADRFSLNGYERLTNPLLAQEEVFTFTNIHSCGTSTAHSVPCMFSYFDRENYSDAKARSYENILDVLHHASVNILWRDNNSNSKGVALRVEYEDFKTAKTNPVCDTECRDVGMLHALENYIAQHQGEDILIVLHQMGNHGPAYYKRYPKEFEHFTPVCKTNQLEECSQEEVSNAYDNAILYTDYFLSEVIKFLKRYDKTHEAAMIYMSDHGESLGEKGLYLHGMPYFIAPEEQTHIPTLMWFGEGMDIDLQREKIASTTDKEFSQDNLFDTLLRVFEVDSELYNAKRDILYDARRY
ncbi:MAG: phosphoethanolamine--lipid A transferase [Helicobacteraceae bacterium]|nr:phosphoethanolamine--lipid A transferase [Helicobacteraceae bacterium]